ncbi:MAG: hypothetical protein Fur0034_21400 [Desulfuromonadia bacterium]
MANCRNCGAPLRTGTITCDYCGSRNDLDRDGLPLVRRGEPDGDRLCPRCGIPLTPHAVAREGELVIDRCGECFGLFFDPGELERILNGVSRGIATVDHTLLSRIMENSPSRAYPVSYIPCPVCRRVMNRTRYGVKSGVIVDRCADHGIWLDGGELRTLMAWASAGGMVHEGQVSAERAREEEKHRREEIRADTGEGGEYDTFRTLMKGGEDDLWGKLSRIARFLMKEVK